MLERDLRSLTVVVDNEAFPSKRACAMKKEKRKKKKKKKEEEEEEGEEEEEQDDSGLICLVCSTLHVCASVWPGLVCRSIVRRR